MRYILLICLYALCIESFSQDSKEKITEVVVAMAKIGSCNAPTFTADGKEILFISNISGLPQIWKIPVNGGWPIQLTSYNDPVTDLACSPKGDQVAFVVAPGGGLNAQVYLMNSNGFNKRMVTPGGMNSNGFNKRMVTPGGKTNNNFNYWSGDGKYITYSSNSQNANALDCFLYDVAAAKSTLISENHGIGSVIDVSEDNDRFLINRLKSRGSNDLYLYSAKDKSEKLLTEHKGPGTFFGSIGKKNELFIGSNKDSDLIRFELLKDNKSTVLAERASEELADIVLNNAKTKAILMWSDAGKNKLSLYDLDQMKESKLPDFPVELIRSVSFSPDDKQIVFAGSGSREPSNIWLFTFSNNAFTKLTESPHAGVDLKGMIEPELVRFKSFDGLELNGWLYKPANAQKPYPTIISYHGGPEGQSIPNFDATAQVMVQRGFAFFLPNVRGSSGFGKKFVNLDNGELRFNGVKDIKACYDYLINTGTSKAGSVGIMGGSYGGYMVMAGVTEYPDMFAAGANLFGVVNFETFFAQTEPWMAAISTVEYGDPKTQADMLRKLSPIHNAGKVKTPLIVLHGANDTNVPVVEAEQVVNSLKQNNVPVKYVLFPDEGHGWRKTNNRVTSTIEIVAWFSKYLK